MDLQYNVIVVLQMSITSATSYSFALTSSRNATLNVNPPLSVLCIFWIVSCQAKFLMQFSEATVYSFTMFIIKIHVHYFYLFMNLSLELKLGSVLH